MVQRIVQYTNIYFTYYLQKIVMRYLEKSFKTNFNKTERIKLHTHTHTDISVYVYMYMHL